VECSGPKSAWATPEVAEELKERVWIFAYAGESVGLRELLQEHREVYVHEYDRYSDGRWALHLACLNQ
jgi:hypothetical protein